ncbi:DUF5361 domain-containing protein [uncultured Rothia sp.]|uniref:DUF5361 domain-containing protein n=1 Tax=uncultured Rothia sp. TaxID=316088 RepID=UPI0025E69E1A|nr:DUF5361 domain-containing protein [uncultured Rothia sp.]
MKLLREHRELIEIDLIRVYGARFADLLEEHGPRLIAAMVVHLPDDSALMRELAQGWGLQDQLLAGIFDRLAEANWQRTEDGQKGNNRPNPLPRPGVKSENSQQLGSGTMSLTEARHWVAERRAGTGTDITEETTTI